MTPGVNFSNILHAAFTHADPKSASNTFKPSVFFALLGSGRVKAARKMLVKLTPYVDCVIVDNTLTIILLFVNRNRDKTSSGVNPIK